MPFIFNVVTGKRKNPPGLEIASSYSMYQFGNGLYGAIGNGLYGNVPFNISDTGNWSKVDLSQSGIGVKTDGTLWVWGSNNYAHLGVTPWQILSSPVQVGTDTNWVDAKFGVANNQNAYVTFALKSDGTLWGAGYNYYGTLGIGNNTYYASLFTQIGAGTTWKSFASGQYASFGIKSDGTLWSWGYDNYSGILGTSQYGAVSRSSPVQIGTDTNWSSISTNGIVAHAIKTDGTLWGWGRNDYYRTVGDNSFVNRSSPVQIGTDTNWASVESKNAYCAMAVKTDGTLWGWGYNAYNFLTPAPFGRYSYAMSPIQIGSSTDWSSIRCGYTYGIFGIKTNGTLWSWGDNNNATLGISNGGDVSSPVQVGSETSWTSVSSGDKDAMGISSNDLYAWGIGASYSNLLDVIVATPLQIGGNDAWISAWQGTGFNGGVKTDGTLWTWGDNSYGQLGHGTTTSDPSPTQVGSDTNWRYYYATKNGSYAIKTDGTLWSWGLNTYGQLGHGNIINRSSPVQVGTNTNWGEMIRGGGNGSIIAVKKDGTLWSWGYNFFAELGLGNSITRSSPVQVGTDTNWSLLNMNNFSSYAIKTDGTLWSWGLNTYGQLGHGNTIGRSSPVQVGSSTNWSGFSTDDGSSQSLTVYDSSGSIYVCGYYSDYGMGFSFESEQSFPNSNGSTWLKVRQTINAAAAIKSDGTLWTWGNNQSYGVLGDGQSWNYKSSPVQLGANTWIDIGCGFQYYMVGIRSDGTLWSWGYADGSGQLGNNLNVSTVYSPVQIGTDTNWNKISCGFKHNLAVKTDGTLWAWGLNQYGLLGDGTTFNRSSPVQIGTDTNWASVFAENYCSFAVKTDGTLWSWGYDADKRLGQSSLYLQSTSSPVQVGTDTNWVKVSCPRYQYGSSGGKVIGLKSDGTIWGWGSGVYGNGNGSSTQYNSPVQIGSDSDWIDVGGSHYYSIVAVKSDGTLWGYGYKVGLPKYAGYNHTTYNVETISPVSKFPYWSKLSNDGQGGLLGIDTSSGLMGYGMPGNNYVLNPRIYTNITSLQYVGTYDIKNSARNKNTGHLIENNGDIYVWGLGGQSSGGNPDRTLLVGNTGLTLYGIRSVDVNIPSASIVVSTQKNGMILK